MPKGKNSKRGANSAGSGPSTSDDATDEGDADTLFYLRTKYSLLGKGDWWWLMDEFLNRWFGGRKFDGKFGL